MHKLAQSVLRYVRRNDLLRPGDRVGVAVSGGADSVALLRFMFELRDEMGLVLSVVHLNHKLRGAESDSDEHFVRELAKSHGLEIFAEGCNVRSYAAEKRFSLEAAARELRYEFFQRAFESRLNRITTGHTLDDQAETVLLKLTRGAGTRGMAGIYPRLAVSLQPSAVSKTEADGEQVSKSDIPRIVRPLLATRRSQLREYLAEIGQSWREDSTNQDPRHTRNRMRHEIIPRLEREVNPAVCEVLAEAAEIARAEEQHWTTEVARLLPEVWRNDDQDRALNSRLLNTFPLAIRRRLVRGAAESLGLALEFSHVEEILNLSYEGDQSSLPAGCTVTRNHDYLRFQDGQQTTANYQYRLPVPGKLAIPEAGVEIETLMVNGASRTGQRNSEHLVDSRFVERGLTVRNWRPGERFWPAHTKQPKKIKELLQDRRVTGDEKQRWPVIASGDEIVWLRGFGIRRDLQVKGSSGFSIRDMKLDPIVGT